MMTIQQYLDKIDLLRKEENKVALFEKDDLESIVLIMYLNSTENYFTIDSLFQKSVSKSITINREIVLEFSNHSGLLFSNETETGNVCYTESNELRSEYRLSFKLIDLLDYIYAFVHSSIYQETQKIILPPDADSFWNLVKIGKRITKAEE